MSPLSFSSAKLFVKAVASGAAEAASAFTRTFETTISLSADESKAEPLDLVTLTPKLSDSGLGLILFAEGKGIIILIPSSSGLFPDWCIKPDVTGKSKLSTFAQEWGMNLLPEDFFPEDFKAGVVGNMLEGLRLAKPDDDGGFLELSVTKADGNTVPCYVTWLLNNPDEFLKAPAMTAQVSESVSLPPPPIIGGAPTFDRAPDLNTDSARFIGQGAPAFQGGGRRKRISIDDLPGYSRSLLKVAIPVTAVLVCARKPIKTVLELGVGSVIQFDKSCDDLLDVEVGRTVSIGKAEAVKVGDKFGFRIHSIDLPKERFHKVEVRREGEYRVKKNLPQIIGKAPIKSLDPNDPYHK